MSLLFISTREILRMYNFWEIEVGCFGDMLITGVLRKNVYIDLITLLQCIAPPADVDCVGTWSACTTACETADKRTFSESVAKSGNGKECPGLVVGWWGWRKVRDEWDGCVAEQSPVHDPSSCHGLCTGRWCLSRWVECYIGFMYNGILLNLHVSKES